MAIVLGLVGLVVGFTLGWAARSRHYVPRHQVIGGDPYLAAQQATADVAEVRRRAVEQIARRGQRKVGRR